MIGRTSDNGPGWKLSLINFLSLFDDFVGLALKGTPFDSLLLRKNNSSLSLSLPGRFDQKNQLAPLFG